MAKKILVAQEELYKRYRPILASISSPEERDNYLRKCNDIYTRFILEKIEEEKIGAWDEKTLYEMHHIIPRVCGGTEDSWNKVRISYGDHYMAHKLRYQAYQEDGDRLAIQLRQSMTEEDQKIGRLKSLEIRREKKLGIHNPLVQSESGKKGGSKWTEGKRDALENRISSEFKAARKSGMTWTHKDGSICVIEAGKIQIPMDLISLLETVRPFPEGTNLKEVPGSLLKVIKGTRKTYQGWSVKINKLDK